MLRSHSLAAYTLLNIPQKCERNLTFVYLSISICFKAWLIDTDNTYNSSHNMREVWKILPFWDSSFPQTMSLRFWVSTVWPQLQTFIIIDSEHIWKHSLRSKQVQNWLQWKWLLPRHGNMSLTFPDCLENHAVRGAVRNIVCEKCKRFWHFVIVHVLKPWFWRYEFPLLGHSSKPW